MQVAVAPVQLGAAEAMLLRRGLGEEEDGGRLELGLELGLDLRLGLARAWVRIIGQGEGYAG